MHIAVVIPAYQAAATLAEVVLRLDAWVPRHDVLVVDDGSRDGTGEVARALGVRLAGFAGNRGKGHALREGFRLTREAEAVITLDADGQHPPERIPDLVRAAQGADLVIGRRARGAGMPGPRRLANWTSSRWASLLVGQPVRDSQSGFRLYRRRLLDVVPLSAGGYELESQILVRAAWFGFRLAEVPIPTVYTGAVSHLSPLRDVPAIVGVFARLSWERLVPPADLRRARLAAGAGPAGSPPCAS
jgi:glycosyltransferase involved in cell wall biosynthesis